MYSKAWKDTRCGVVIWWSDAAEHVLRKLVESPLGRVPKMFPGRTISSEGRPTPRWQPLHASYAAGAADARSRAPCTLFLAATAARFVIEQS